MCNHQMRRIPSEVKKSLPAELLPCLIEALKNDPRPSYIDDPCRVFGFFYDKYEIKFTVEGKVLNVISIEKVK